jgi:hypothetical protein
MKKPKVYTVPWFVVFIVCTFALFGFAIMAWVGVLIWRKP